MSGASPAATTSRGTGLGLWLLRGFAWMLLAAAAAYQIAIVFTPLEFLVREVTVDDTYLYLQIAVNWAATGVPTFDGIAPTNGYQPLWQMVLTGLALVIGDRETLVRTVCLLAALFNLVTAPLVWMLAREVADWTVAYVAMIGWTTFLFCPRSASGMEASLHGVVFALATLVLLRTWKRLPDVRPTHMLAVGGLLALNGFCRLDSGILSAMVALLLAGVLVRARKRLAVACLAVIPAVTLSVYLVANQLYFGAATPVSGRAKMFWAHEAAEHSLGEMAVTVATGAVRTLSNTFMDVTGGGDAYSYPWLPILAVLVAAALAQSWKAGKLDRRLIAWGALMGVHVLIMHLTLLHLAKFSWYYQPLHIFAAVVVGHLAYLHAPWFAPRIQRVAGATLMVGVCIFGVSRGTEKYAIRHTYAGDDHLHVYVLHMARWLATATAIPPEARLGSWNTGELSYFSGRTVVNLDGLVQSADFVPRVLRGARWKDYLQEAHIDYLVDYNYEDSTQTYNRQWDRKKVFRDLVPFSEAEVIHRVGPLLVIDIHPWLAEGQNE